MDTNTKASPRTYVADGIVSIEVEHGHLVIESGYPRGSRTKRLSRVEREIDRIVIPGRMGYVTLEAMRWLSDVGISWSSLSDGQPTGYASNRGADALLVRAQAKLPDRPTGVVITRRLLTRKIERQLDNVRLLRPDQAEPLETCLAELDAENRLVGLRGIEARAAKAYWGSWCGVEMRFRKEDKVPDHWRVFKSRLSPISVSAPRNAGDPLNACLNYSYGVLETETITACHEMGIDPLLGILHTDQRYRYSMAHDLMEVGRPLVDLSILEWIETRVFRKSSDFVETSNGTVRIRQDLTGHLAAMVRSVIPDCYSTWEWVLNQIVEDMARGDKRARTPLSKNNAKARFARK